jgi:hypothetical protein
MDKDKIIAQVYNDPLGFGSNANTLKDARKIDPSITLQDVIKWKEANIERVKQLNVYNSYIPKEPYDEYQVDLFFMNGLRDQEYKVGLLMVDVFTKYTEVIQIKDKTEGSLLSALMEGFHKMGRKPKTIYSDDEPALSSKYTKQFFKENNITFLITRTHAAFAERQIRTIKDMIHKRMKNSENDQWTDHIGYVLLTYNHKMINRTTHMTPYDARKPKNELEVKQHIVLKAKHNRLYPDINIGDKVKIYVKKKTFDKEHVPVWSKDSYEVESIDMLHDQQFYKVQDKKRPFMRHEILKVPS